MRTILPLMFIFSGCVAAQGKYNNIRVLKIPEDQVIEYMLSVTESLGVECTFCHDPHAFAADDYKTKERARVMMTMVQELNAKFPAVKAKVTCYTCHRAERIPKTEAPAK